jgi:hypothetical protein
LPIGSVVKISSVAGSVRAQHLHARTGWHYCHVTKGRVNYVERHPKTGITTRKTFVAGETFFTPPQVEHAMFFPEPTEFWCFSGNERTHVAYENDLVRLETPLTWEGTAAVIVPPTVDASGETRGL